MVRFKKWKQSRIFGNANQNEQWAVSMRESISDHGSTEIMNSGQQQDPPPADTDTESQEGFDQSGENQDISSGGKDDKDSQTSREENNNGAVASNSKAHGPNADNSYEENFESEGTDDPPTLTNNTKSTIWFKPEDNNLAPMSLAPGESTTMAIDGVTHPDHPGQVFKVRGGFDAVFGVDANPSGIVVGSDSALWPLPSEVNHLFGGGWLTTPPDSGWNAIFDRAGYKGQ